MMTLTSMPETTVTNEFVCDFCSKVFRREKSMFTHVCEQKRRHLNKDLVGNRLGFQCWLTFYKRNTNARKPKTYLDFCKSPYYTAFVKFGNYCSEINAINIPRFLDYLLENQIRIDNWCSDQAYTKYLISYLKQEDPYDAIARSIENTIVLAEENNIQAHDCFRYCNKNRICYLITVGKISPWMLYQSVSGIEFLETLDEPQQLLIFDYINPEQWALKFHKNKEIVQDIKKLLSQAGY